MRIRIFAFAVLVSLSKFSFAQPGNSLHFDGSNDYVYAGDAASLDLTGSYTLECWFKADAFSFLGGLISKYQISSANGYTLRLASTAPYSGLNFDGLETATGILQAGTWYHVAAVNNAGVRKLYLNGVEQTLTGSSYTVVNNNNVLTLGADFINGGVRYFNGNIDEVRLWNTAKTQPEIQASMLAAVSTSAPGLAAYYRFNQGTAGGNNGSVTTLTDLTTNANTATLFGFALSGNTSNWTGSLAMSIPVPAANNNYTTTSFKANWSLSGGGSVDKYYLDVGTDPNFIGYAIPYINMDIGNVTSYNITGLSPLTTYYYRLRGSKNNIGSTVNSAVTTATLYSTGSKIYVNQSAAPGGDGSSWATAFKELRDAVALINTSPVIDSILVAAGTYKTTPGTDRTIYLNINRGGLKIIGGYASDGSGIRNISSNPTYIDGDIGTASDTSDNSNRLLVIHDIAAGADSVVIDGFTFRHANGYYDQGNVYGGGIFFGNVGNGNKAVVRNCSFTNNYTEYGGAMVVYLSAPLISNCTFTSNAAITAGGALYIWQGGNTTISNCNFTSNNADAGLNATGGGAVYFEGSVPVNFSDCSFTNNHSVYTGGAVAGGAAFNGGGTANFTNAIFTGNKSGQEGGAVYLNTTTASFSNSSFTGNRSTTATGGAIFSALTSGFPVPLTIINSRFESDTAVYGGAIRAQTIHLKATGNVFYKNIASADGGGAIHYNAASTSQTDSLINNIFIQNKGVAGVGTGGAVSIANGSNYILNNTFYKDTANNGGALGLDGGTSQVYNNVFYKNYSGNGTAANNDIEGTYTGSNNSFGTTDPLFFNENDPDGNDNTWATADDGLALTYLSSSLNTGDNSKLPPTITTDITGAARIQSTTVDKGAYEGSRFTSNKIYINQSVSVSGDGGSWATAIKELRDALPLLSVYTNVDSVLVAAGTYYPGSNYLDNFAIQRGGVKLYGGYAASGNGSRNITANPTYMDGNIGLPGYNSNTIHILQLYLDDAADSVVIDGFTIRNAIANNDNDWHGGGMTANVINFTKLAIRHCSFINNHAEGRAGGISLTGNGNSYCYISDCVFTSNTANQQGGAIYAEGIRLAIKGSSFISGTASAGGAVHLEGSSSLWGFGNVFKGNVANSNGGGAIYYNTDLPGTPDTLINNLFIQNQTNNNVTGGAIYVFHATQCNIINNTFYSNSAISGSSVGIFDGTAKMYNNIFNEGSGSDIGSFSSSSYTQANNIFTGTDPSFTDESDPDGADNIFGTNDDGLKLLSNSVGLNAGDNSKVPADIITDVTGIMRIQNSTVDIGAYETTAITGNKLYVNQSVTVSGDGSSWATAIKELKDAMLFIPSNTIIDSVLVAAGNYKPTSSADRTVFLLLNRGGIKLYGGYSADGSGVRDINANITYLNGDIGTTGIQTDNSYRVLVIQNVSSSADSIVVDGFTIQNSYLPSGISGGILMNNTANEKKTTIRNCRFTNCEGEFGGGMSVISSSPMVEGCSFENNMGKYGGGMQLAGASGMIINNCNFSFNTTYSSGLGGAVRMVNTYPATFSNCTFTGNSTTASGGGIQTTTSTLILNNCLFEKNTAGAGGGIAFGTVNLYVSSCRFSENKSATGGGAIMGNTSANDLPVELTNCIFIKDTAVYGGALRFENNGGTINLTARGNTFYQNISTNGGGGAVNHNINGMNAWINNIFIQNKDISGGGNVGGAVALAGGNHSFVNNTFYKDTASNGGAIAIVSGTAACYNNIFYKNYSANGVTASNDINASFTGADNMLSTTNPSFADEDDPDGADNIFGTSDDGLRLLPCSYAVNRGDNTKIPSGVTTDIATNNRIFNVQTDIGAYELPSLPGSGNIPNATTSALTQPVYGGVTSIGADCNLIGLVEPNGADAVNGNVAGRLWIESSVPQYNSYPYVARHYEITPANNPSTATARVTLFFTQAEFDAFNTDPGSINNLPANSSDNNGIIALRVIKFDGTSNNATGLPATYTGSNLMIDPANSDIVWNATDNRWEISFNVTGFSGFIVTTVAGALPVDLVSFTGKLAPNKKVKLEWKVASQLNIREYVVERSADARSYTTIGTVTANTQNSYTYNFTDAQPADGNNFYRLKIVEDNHNKYSRTVRVDLNDAGRNSLLYPNPAKDFVILQSNDLSLLKTEAQLVDMQGRILKKIVIDQLPMQIETGSLVRGHYLLKTINGEVFKIIKR